MLTPINTICFGDSHCEYFKDIFTIQRYDAASAKGLNNIKSQTQTNQKIRKCIQENPNKYYVFYFGKVDVDFGINYKYNENPKLDLYKFIDSVVEQYITFLESLSISNIIVFELPISHLENHYILNYMNKQNVVSYINNYMSNADTIKPTVYKNVIPWKTRNELILYMGVQLEAACILRRYTYVPINRHFLRNDGSYEIPNSYVYENRFDDFQEQPHHLGRNICKLYIQSLQALRLA